MLKTCFRSAPIFPACDNNKVGTVIARDDEDDGVVRVSTTIFLPISFLVDTLSEVITVRWDDSGETHHSPSDLSVINDLEAEHNYTR